MRRFLLITAAALALASCNKGRAWYQDGDVIAGAQAAGFTDVTVVRPQFACAADHVGPVNTGGSTGFQQGNFFTAISPDGQRVRAAICHGLSAPNRILVLGPDRSGFSPDDEGNKGLTVK